MKKIILSIILGIALIASLSVFGVGVVFGNSVGERNEKIDVLISFYQMPENQERILVHSFGGKINRSYNNFSVIAASIPEQAISSLLNYSSVRSIELDKKVYAVGYLENEEYENSWGVTHIKADLAHEKKYLGESIKVAIIDSGVDYNHRDLVANFDLNDLGYDFVKDDEDPNDVYGHGTHVAGTVGAIIDGFGVVGVAPKVQLISLRILNDDGVGSESNTLAALDWILDYNNKEENSDNPIRITNNSYGRGSSSSSLKEAFKSLEDVGVLNVAAAGNSGNPAGKNDSIIYPAKYSSVVAIGAVDKDNNRPNWSSTGPDLELVAPGVSVLSTWNSDESYANPQPICFEDDNKCHYYKEGSGTSMASPHVAGTAALAWAINSNLTNTEIREVLQQTAEDLRLSLNHQGYGLVRADLVVAAVLEFEPPVTGNIGGIVKDEIGAAIKGATVIVEDTDLSATTDENGFYLITDVPIGTYDVTASVDGYYSETATVTIEEDATVTQDFTLQVVPTYTVSGTVTDSESNALEGAIIIIEGTEIVATTDGKGSYLISDIVDGVYDITVSKSGYISETKNVTVGSDTIIDFVLEEVVLEGVVRVESIVYITRGGRFDDRHLDITLILLDDEHNSVVDASVLATLERNGSSWGFQGITGSDGTVTFSLNNHGSGCYWMEVIAVDTEGLEWDEETPENGYCK